MINIRRRQRNFGDGFIHETVDELWKDWMRRAELILVDEELLEIVYRTLQRRHPRKDTLALLLQCRGIAVRNLSVHSPTHSGEQAVRARGILSCSLDAL